MKSYNVAITELRSRIVIVRGENTQAARKEARRKWKRSAKGFCLTTDDLAEVCFTVLGSNTLFHPNPLDGREL